MSPLAYTRFRQLSPSLFFLQRVLSAESLSLLHCLSVSLSLSLKNSRKHCSITIYLLVFFSITHLIVFPLLFFFPFSPFSKALLQFSLSPTSNRNLLIWVFAILQFPLTFLFNSAGGLSQFLFSEIPNSIRVCSIDPSVRKWVLGLCCRGKWGMFSWLARMASACWKPVRRYARMNKDDDEDCSLEDSLLWSRELEKHSNGEFSFAVVQANEIIEDNSQVETGRDATFVGVYDGHGGPDASRFICDHLFRNLMSESSRVASLLPFLSFCPPFLELFWVLTVLFMCSFLLIFFFFLLLILLDLFWTFLDSCVWFWNLWFVICKCCCHGFLFGIPVPLGIDFVKSVNHLCSTLFVGGILFGQLIVRTQNYEFLPISTMLW